VEGWILGVPGLIRTRAELDPSQTCSIKPFRLH
jgi:hypothetical protein